MPMLLAVSNLNSTISQSDPGSYDLYQPRYIHTQSGMQDTVDGISISNVTAAWNIGLQLHSQGFPAPVNMSVPGGQVSFSAPPIPPIYQYGRFRPYLDTFPMNLPGYYPVNVTFMLTGPLYATQQAIVKVRVSVSCALPACHCNACKTSGGCSMTCMPCFEHATTCSCTAMTQ